MKLIRDFDAFPDAVRGGAVAIGNFDGVHLGHARIVAQLLARAKQLGGPAVVFTFDPHPVLLLRPDKAPPPLTWTDRKAELLAELGIDTTIAYPTDEALLKLTPEEFFKTIVIDRLQAKAMVEGPNFYFGRNRAGTIDVLQKLCFNNEISLDIVKPLEIDNEQVSSSRVRQLISAGDIQAANRLLTEPYRIRGMVRHGAARGAKIGFPTANVDAIDTLLPCPGVYAGRSKVGGAVWPVAVNIGPNPTFGEQALKVEVHIIGFQGTLYGEPLEVDFTARLRDIVRFNSVDELKRQLSTDIESAKQLHQSSAHV
jgi:riboflavin kinase/FMN adenylyltransferase